MNSVIFVVDTNDILLECIYYEDYRSKQGIKIDLPYDRIKNYFMYLVSQNEEINQVINDSVDIFTFYDIDVDMIDVLINESNLYRLNKNSKRNNQTNDNIMGQTKNNVKVTRTNKFRKNAIKVSVSLLAALSLFSAAKEGIKNLKIEDVFPISYIDSFNTFRSQKNEFKIDDFTEIEILDDEKIDEIPSALTKEEDTKSTIITNNEQDIYQENKVVPDCCLRLDAEDLVDCEKYYMCKAYYLDSLTDIANRYGVDPNLAMAVGIHERGIHSDEVDSGGAVGLFQIQVEGGWNWDNKSITAYNFETNQYENVLITKESVSDVFENMRVGCMMLQNLLVSYDYNVAKAVTAYNYGSTNLSKVLERCSLETGISVQKLDNMDHLEWLEYRNIIGGGDPEYLENVFKYIPNGTILSFTKPNHENVNIQYDNLAYEANRVMK